MCLIDVALAERNFISVNPRSRLHVARSDRTGILYHTVVARRDVRWDIATVRTVAHTRWPKRLPRGLIECRVNVLYGVNAPVSVNTCAAYRRACTITRLPLSTQIPDLRHHFCYIRTWCLRYIRTWGRRYIPYFSRSTGRNRSKNWS